MGIGRGALVTADRRIGPLGTAARVLIGVGLVSFAIAADRFSWWDAVGAVVVLPATALVVAVVANRLLTGTPTATEARRPWSAAQAVVSAGIVVVVLALGTALTFVSPINGEAMFVFVGCSMVLAAARGFDGCEILAIPNLVLRRGDSIWCPLYSPLDGIERGGRG